MTVCLACSTQPIACKCRPACCLHNKQSGYNVLRMATSRRQAKHMYTCTHTHTHIQMDGQSENILPIAEAVICHRIRSGLCDNEEQSLEQLEDVEHWKIQHAIFNVVFCSVFSSNSFSLLLRKTLYCALQKLRDSRGQFLPCL